MVLDLSFMRQGEVLGEGVHGKGLSEHVQHHTSVNVSVSLAFQMTLRSQQKGGEKID